MIKIVIGPSSSGKSTFIASHPDLRGGKISLSGGLAKWGLDRLEPNSVVHINCTDFLHSRQRVLFREIINNRDKMPISEVYVLFADPEVVRKRITERTHNEPHLGGFGEYPKENKLRRHDEADHAAIYRDIFETLDAAELNYEVYLSDHNHFRKIDMHTVNEMLQSESFAPKFSLSERVGQKLRKREERRDASASRRKEGQSNKPVSRRESNTVRAVDASKAEITPLQAQTTALELVGSGYISRITLYVGFVDLDERLLYDVGVRDHGETKRVKIDAATGALVTVLSGNATVKPPGRLYWGTRTVASKVKRILPTRLKDVIVATRERVNRS